MLPSPLADSALPAFDQAQLDLRFLAELDRLLQAEVFTSYTAWAAAVGVGANIVAAIASGRYHCNLRLLYDTTRCFPATDFQYVLFSSSDMPRPELVGPPKRQRGRPKAVPKAGDQYESLVTT